MDERAQLVLAERHIAEAERRIAEQERRVLSLSELGGDTAEAQRLLEAFRATLKELKVHRQLIVERLARSS